MQFWREDDRPLSTEEQLENNAVLESGLVEVCGFESVRFHLRTV